MHQKTVMNSDSSRLVVTTCDLCHSKLQTIAEILLLSCEARPIVCDEITPFSKSYSRCRDDIFERLKVLSNVVKDLMSQIYTVTVRWQDITAGVVEMTNFVAKLVECCDNIAYLVAISFPNCSPALPGVVDKYQVSLANLELKLYCSRLKRSRLDDLNPQILVETCSSISKSLAVMTEICRQASELTQDHNDQEQFKLCVKSVTSSASCLISSIKSFKSRPNAVHLGRIIAFCDPVISSSSAMASFSTEQGFIGTPAELTSDAKDIHKSILGATLSVISSCIQICKSVRDLVYDIMNSRHRDRVIMCAETIDRASAKLRDILSCYNLDDTSSNSSSTGTSVSTKSSTVSSNSR
ncbi:talin rod domain-containing protein 1-like [Gigantopelta aegis]|uniref:talin rod domain-containing protein 1-like n=1 Tax=Gigantopelta aegis TaxID=1735272 RepID=UPI001B88D073|nr:talin rod domain-containing protein 1-like [Gigantopelta aegis]XP_041356027.1 talin rod domain-containing protein 1-like [Gigantopelta aegis]XP_041356028.1 talin rod domain-containing protein 1-like [Gigantopelta aegis]